MNMKKRLIIGIIALASTSMFMHAASNTIRIKNSSGKNIYVAIYSLTKEERADTVITTRAVRKTDVKNIVKGKTIRLDRPIGKNIALLASAREGLLKNLFNVRTSRGKNAFKNVLVGNITAADRSVTIVKDEDIEGGLRLETQEDIFILERALTAPARTVEALSPFGR